MGANPRIKDSDVMAHLYLFALDIRLKKVLIISLHGHNASALEFFLRYAWLTSMHD